MKARVSTRQPGGQGKSNPPDTILREVFDAPESACLDRDVISQEELAALSDGYKRIAGYHRETLSGSG
jgi:hypothetical protein